MAKADEFLIALNKGENTIVKSMIENGDMDVNVVYPSLGYTPLHYATKNRNILLMEILLDLGANINAQSKRQMTPLHLAAENGDIRTISFLLKRGADYMLRDEDQRTAFQTLKILGYIDLLKPMRALLDEVEAVNSRSRYHRSNLLGQIVNFFSRLTHTGIRPQAHQNLEEEPLINKQKTL